MIIKTTHSIGYLGNECAAFISQPDQAELLSHTSELCQPLQGMPAWCAQFFFFNNVANPEFNKVSEIGEN